MTRVKLSAMNITVVIPTYRRPEDLERCLEALKKQTIIADEVLIVVRSIDDKTWSFLENFDQESLPIRVVQVSMPGQIVALNAGLDEAKGEIIAITDDDAVPHTDWLERIKTHYLTDKALGGVGGRDFLYINNQLVQGTKKTVGKLQWFGRAIGNHHLGIGETREVDMLKGANMSFHKNAIAGLRFDQRLRGTGAQVHNDLMFCLMVKKRGWKIIYDPKIEIDHYQGQRFDEDKRQQFNSLALSNMVHNETLALLEYLSPLRSFAFLIWAVLIGTSGSPGLLQWLRFLPSQGVFSGQKLLSSLRGRWQGYQTWQISKNHLLNRDYYATE
jgi:glycosyltransferase involved in cell wall biosynthesis